MSDFLNSIPEDFAAFWQEIAAEATLAPLDYHRQVIDSTIESHLVEMIDFRGISGERLHGWIAYPEAARRLPSFLWIAPYGRSSMLPNKYGTREGFTSMSFNFFGHEAFHEEKYVVERGYFSEGSLDPETWIFKTIAQNAMIALRVLQAQNEVDEDRIGAMGMSQGGGLSIWMGAWSPVVKAVCADMPFLGTISEQLQKPVYRYPLKELVDFVADQPLGLERLLHTVSYFDTAYHARYCYKPTHVTSGLRDPASKPEHVKAIFEALPDKKELLELDWGHDWHEQMIATDQSWLLENMA